MENQQNTAVILIVAVVVGGLGWYLGYQQGARNSRPPSGYASRALPPAPAPAMPADLRSISGAVKSVSGDSIVIKVNSFASASSASSDERTVVAMSSTVIERNKQKDTNVFQKEIEAYNAKMRSQTTSSTSASPTSPPDPFVHQKITLADVKPGEMVNVTANENIAKAKKFTAVSITISTYSASTLPPPPLGGASAYGAPPTALPPVPSSTNR